MLDEEATAACWAWEQDYIGMEIAGTIHNEVRIDGPLDSPADEPAAPGKPRPVAQHEPSGGGRSIPQHVRLSARESRSAGADRIEQRTAGLLRRTRIRRGREEIAAVGSLLAAEAVEMTGAPATYPSPGPHCLACEFMVAVSDAVRRLPTPNRLLAVALPSTLGRTPSRSRDWVRRRGASAEERHHRLGERNSQPQELSRMAVWESLLNGLAVQLP